MKKKRLIPVLLLRDGFLVQSKLFKNYQNLGNPLISVKRLSEWGSDELIYLDISKEERYDQRRDDLRHPNHNNILSILEEVSKFSFMPTTFGGKIRTLQDIYDRLSRGADKISINTKPLEDRSFIGEGAKVFGSQCIIVSMDIKLINGVYKVMKASGKEETPYTATEWAKIAQEEGAGEILLNSVDRDGTKEGFDIDLINTVVDSVNIPVIAMGGAGEIEDFGEVLEKTNADAVAAANIFQYFDQSVYLVKKDLYERNFNVRNPDLFLIK
jgi:cyclase